MQRAQSSWWSLLVLAFQAVSVLGIHQLRKRMLLIAGTREVLYATCNLGALLSSADKLSSICAVSGVDDLGHAF